MKEYLKEELKNKIIFKYQRKTNTKYDRGKNYKKTEGSFKD